MRYIKQLGFSLVELAIILIIVGGIAAMTATLGVKWVAKEEVSSIRLNLQTIENALDNYARRNLRLPCPADPSITDPTDPNYGVEAANMGNCTGGATQAEGVGGTTVRGPVPAATLGIGKNLMRDIHGNYADYYVDSRMTEDNAMKQYHVDNTTIGDITIQDPAGGVRTAKAVYALVSFGANAHGARNASGTIINAGTTDDRERENNDRNPDGSSSGADNILVQGLLEPDFDDQVLYKTRSQLEKRDIIVGSDNCDAGTISWVQGAYTCTGNSPSMVSGETVQVLDEDYTIDGTDEEGSVDVVCDSGAIVTSNPICDNDREPCAAGTASWTVSGKNCSSARPAMTHGQTLNDHPDTSLPQTGSVDIQCLDTVLSQSDERCYNQCASQSVNWVSGLGSSCTATSSALAHGGSATISDSSGTDTGSVTVTCNDGTLSQSGGSCTGSDDCSGGAVSWSLSGNTCNGTVGALSHGSSSNVTDSGQPTTGSRTFTCSNGGLNQSGGSCVQQCASQAVNWTVSGKTCSATSGIMNHGASKSVSDSTQPTTGSRNLSCNNGTISNSGGTCVEQCANQTVSWTIGGRTCAVASGVLNHGASKTITDSTNNFTGTRNISCSNGTLSDSGGTCYQSCVNQTVSWSSCSGASGATLAHGAGRTISNTKSGYTGSRNISCSNGSLSQSGGSCKATSSCTGIVTGHVKYGSSWACSGGSVVATQTSGSSYLTVTGLNACQTFCNGKSGVSCVHATASSCTCRGGTTKLVGAYLQFATCQ